MNAADHFPPGARYDPRAPYNDDPRHGLTCRCEDCQNARADLAHDEDR